MIALAILALGTACAALLALAVELAHRQPLPRRVGFEVRYEHKPERSK
jgi:hypothetical protein